MSHTHQGAVIPGPPFLFGACIVLVSFLVAVFIPEYSKGSGIQKHNCASSNWTNTSARGSGREDIAPLLQDSSAWELSSFEEPGNQCTELWPGSKGVLQTLPGCEGTPRGDFVVLRGDAGGTLLSPVWEETLNPSSSFSSILFLSVCTLEQVKVWSNFLQMICNSQSYLESKLGTSNPKSGVWWKEDFPLITPDQELHRLPRSFP